MSYKNYMYSLFVIFRTDMAPTKAAMIGYVDQGGDLRAIAAKAFVDPGVCSGLYVYQGTLSRSWPEWIGVKGCEVLNKGCGTNYVHGQMPEDDIDICRFWWNVYNYAGWEFLEPWPTIMSLDEYETYLLETSVIMKRNAI